MGEDGIHDTVYIERVTLAAYNTQGYNGTERERDKQNASIGRTEDVATEKAPTIRWIPGQHALKHVLAGEKMKYLVPWNGYGPGSDFEKLPRHILQQFIARYFARRGWQKL